MAAIEEYMASREAEKQAPPKIAMWLPSGRMVEATAGGKHIGFSLRVYEPGGAPADVQDVPLYAMRAILAFFAKDLEAHRD